MYQLLLTSALSVLPAQLPQTNPYTPTPPATKPAPRVPEPSGNTSNRWTPNLPQYGQTGLELYLPPNDPATTTRIFGYRFGGYAVVPQAARAFPPGAGGAAGPDSGVAPGDSGALQTPGQGGLNTISGGGATPILRGTGREIVPELAGRSRPGVQIRPFPTPADRREDRQGDTEIVPPPPTRQRPPTP